MDRRHFIKLAGITGITGINSLRCSKAEAVNNTTAGKPNIIFILADDAGYGDISCYGQKKFKTANIDRLADEGMKFTQHYAGSSVCAPSRSCLMTGLHTGHSFIRNNTRTVNPVGNAALPYETTTVADLLKKAGYTNGIIGKWGLGGPGSTGTPGNHGFDYFYGFLDQLHAHSYYPEYVWRNDKKVTFEDNNPDEQKGQYVHDLFTEEALGFVKKNQKNPFFLYLAYTIPHSDLDVPQDSMEPFLDKFSEPKPYKGGRYHPQKHPRAAFAGMMHRMDRDIGRLMDMLKDLNIDNNTLVIFAGDNGSCFSGGNDPEFFDSNGPLRGIKQDMYEGGIRVPMIARWPGKIKPASVTDHISAFWDFLPTAAQIAGVQNQANIDGISFLPTLVGKANDQKTHEYLYWEFSSLGGRQAIRMGKWKAVRPKIAAEKPGDLPELYDLDKDVEEKNNIADLNPDITAKIQTLFKQARTLSEQFPLPVEKQEISFQGLGN